jgi:hypothetical protein
MTKLYECGQAAGGVYARPITPDNPATPATNRGPARLIVAAPDSWTARQIAAGFNAASNAGTAGESYTVAMRDGFAVIARAEAGQ